MTSALTAISRLDDGLATPADRVIADVFDRHVSAVEHRRLTVLDAHVPAGFCLVCGERMPDGDTSDECDHCYAAQDFLVDRSADL